MNNCQLGSLGYAQLYQESCRIFAEDLFSDVQGGGCFYVSLTGLALLHIPLESTLAGQSCFQPTAQSLAQ